MLLVKYFSREVYKLKGFLIQIKIKIINKGLGLPMAIKQVTYIGLFLTRRVLKQIKHYFIEIQIKGLNTTNVELRYIFLIQKGITN